MTVAGSYCRYCGARIEPNSKFCSNCGRATTPLATAAPAAGGGGSSSGRPHKTRSKKKFAGIVVLVIIGIFGGLYALGTYVENMDGANLSRGNSSMTSQPQQPTQQVVKPQSPSDPLSDPQALVREVGAYMYQQGWKYPQEQGDINMTRVATGIVRSKYIEDSAVVVIITTPNSRCWSGSIMGSDNVQATHEGCNTGYIIIPCSGIFGSYSLAMQMSDEALGNTFLVQVWKGGELLKQAQTRADYGMVSFAGNC